MIQTKEQDKFCINCIWFRSNGKPNDNLITVITKPIPPFACYYNGIWRMWLDKKKAEIFPICLLSDKPEKLKLCNAKWSNTYKDES